MNKNDYYSKYLKYKMKYLHEKQMQIGGNYFTLTLNYNEKDYKYTVLKTETIQSLKNYIKFLLNIPQHLQHLQHLSINFWDETKTLENLSIDKDTKIIVNKMNFILIRLEEKIFEMPLDPDYIKKNFVDMTPASLTVNDLKNIVIQQPFSGDHYLSDLTVLEQLDRIQLKFNSSMLENDKKLDNYGIVFDNPSIIIDYSFRPRKPGTIQLEIDIKDEKNTLLHLEIEPTKTFGDIKTFINKKTRISVDKLLIIFNSKQIDDNMVLSDFIFPPNYNYSKLLVFIRM